MDKRLFPLQDVRIEYKDGLPIPKLARVRQTFPAEPDLNIAKTVSDEIVKLLSGKELAGKRIAVAVGSRGIPELDIIVREVIRQLRDSDAIPFVIPAMGSHGGATAEGQRTVLQAYGITEEAIGAPVKASMETIQYGSLNGTPLHCDRLAMESDGIILINKIKPHTDFHGAIESGLVKMCIIGLGKHAGAAAFHSLGFSGFSERLQEAYPIFAANAPLLGGIAVIQNAYDRLSMIEAIPVDQILSREKELLEIAREKMPSVPIDKADLLILDEIGKNISGSGFDPNVFAWEGDPTAKTGTVYDRLYIRSLTPESEGHGTGAYFSDVLSQRTVNQIDWGKTWTNCMTLNLTKEHGIPIFLNCDRDAIRALVNCFRPEEWGKLRILRVRNTLRLETFDVSEALWEEIKGKPGIQQLSAFRELTFDEQGYLSEF